MADPLSVLGGVSAASALAGQAITAISFICEVYGKYKDPSFTTQQVEQLKQLANLLHDIQLIKEPQSSTFVTILEACVHSVEVMKTKLADILVDSRDKRRLKLWKSIKGVKKKPEVGELFDDIEQQKSSLSLAMSNMHLSQGQTHTLLLERIDDNTQNARMNGVAPRTFYSVPSRRVQNFVGREEILAKIDGGFFGDHRNVAGRHIVVVRGLGGQGKTQIALEYCRRSKQAFRGIFWVNANSEAAAKESFQTIAHDIKDSAEVVPDDATPFVLKKLNLWNDGWLLVFDNYDDVESFDTIQDFMPDNDTGCILVTSRNTAAEQLTREDCALQLEGLPEEDALELLRNTGRLAPFDADIILAKRIIEQLAYHPLAITQAGSYIQRQKLRLDQFIEHYKDKKKILEHIPSLTLYKKQLGNAERETAMNVFTTWELSFEQVLRSSEGVEKGDLLTLFAFFDNKDISEELFSVYCTVMLREKLHPSQEGFESCPWPVPCLSICLRSTTEEGQHSEYRYTASESIERYDSMEWDTAGFRSLLDEFARTSLVQSWSPGENEMCHLTIHPLIRDWIRLRLDDSKSRFCALLSGKILFVFLWESWSENDIRFKLSLPTQQIILSHVEVYEHNRSLLENRPAVMQTELHNERLDLSDLWIWKVLNFCGRYNEAEKIAIRAYEEALQNLGRESEDAMMRASDLATAYEQVGKLNLSEAMGREALRISRGLFGHNHAGTLDKQRRLADVLYIRGKYAEAEEMVRESLQGLEDLLGPDHRDVLSSLDVLGQMLVQQQSYVEAESVYRRVLVCEERNLGVNHGDTLITVSRLGTIYQAQGQLDLAEQMKRRALEGTETKHGRDHPYTLTHVHNLAILFQKQGKMELAEEMMSRAAEGGERRLGEGHLETLRSVKQLADIISEQGRYEEAEVLYQRTLPGLTGFLGPEHPVVINSAWFYRECMIEMGKVDEAATLLKELQIPMYKLDEIDARHLKRRQKSAQEEPGD